MDRPALACVGKERLLEEMPPYQGGGDMIKSVTFEKTIQRPAAQIRSGDTEHRGRDRVGGGGGLRRRDRMDRISAHERELLAWNGGAVGVPGLTLIGTAAEKSSVLSFVMDGVHPHDIGTVVDQEGVAIRTGHHCAQPLMQRLGIPATARASLALYNTREEIDALVAALQVRQLFYMTDLGSGCEMSVDRCRCSDPALRIARLASVRSSGSVSRGHPRPQPPTATSARLKAPTAMPRATTRSAGIGCRST